MEEEIAIPVVKIHLSEDWKTIKFTNWMGVCTAMATPYNFDEQKIVNFKSYKIFSYTIGMLIFVMFPIILIDRFYKIYPYMPISTVTLDVLNLTVLIAFNLIMIGMPLVQSEEVHQFYNSLIRNDMYLHPKKEDNKHFCVQNKKYKILSSIIFFIFFVLMVYDSYVRVGVFGRGSLKTYFIQNVLGIATIFLTFQLRQILNLLTNRFKSSVQILLKLVDDMHCVRDEQKDEAHWARVTNKIQPRKEDVMQLKLLSRIFATLFEALESLNKFFQWKLLALHFISILQVMEGLNFLVAYASGMLQYPIYENICLIILRIAWAILMAGR